MIRLILIRGIMAKSTHPTGQNMELELYVDGNLVDSTQGVINANSEETFNLHWIARQGEHSHTIKAYSIVGGEKFTEDTENGEVTVSSDFNGLSAWLEVYPNSVEAGGNVSVHITIKNSENYKRDLSISIVDDSGTIWWPNPDKTYEDENYTIKNNILTLYAGKTMREWADFTQITQNTTLYLKVGGKTLASAKINVIQPGPVKTNMECNPTVVPLDGSTTCTVHFELKSTDAVTLNLEEVDFGGKKVWPNGPGSVTVNKQTVTLTPTNMQEDLTVTITVNDELANYYFGKPVYRTYIDKFAGHSYLIEAKFNELDYPVSDIITILYKDTRSGTDKAIDYGSTVGEIISTAQLAVEGSNPLGWAVFTLTSLPKLGKVASEVQWIFEWNVNRFPQENDNNAVVGG